MANESLEDHIKKAESFHVGNDQSLQVNDYREGDSLGIVK